MPTLLLIRHGETDWNRSGRVMGDQPIPLNYTGEQQARACADMLAQTPIAGIFTSPVLRAVQTADILSQAQATRPQHLAGLREIGVGDWINRYWQDFAEETAKRNWYTQPDQARPIGGETLREVQKRAVTAVEQVLQTAHEATYLLVSHGDVIRALLAHYLRLNLTALRHARIDHAGVSGLKLADDIAHLLFLNHRPGVGRLA
ncbi:MAG: histidine phosphatase family protein [Nitrospira sp.]|uniref:Adenosylcobalamin/alpha-ribazole phosphatase n=1 Tax=Nitrospira defluvii TaxID=330214 RepID=A0ABN7KNE8_9BACT|nr:histidine phosphatase family protein [Nitrospira defluvii]MCS6325970.1 histidine phosphatase family protein [Nitrospira sp.]CAE6701893.1 putative Adenosylcobalamin/alpha-ribazole phosphatase [Nitrospira defluvii]